MLSYESSEVGTYSCDGQLFSSLPWSTRGASLSSLDSKETKCVRHFNTPLPTTLRYITAFEAICRRTHSVLCQFNNEGSNYVQGERTPVMPCVMKRTLHSCADHAKWLKIRYTQVGKVVSSNNDR